MAETMDAILVDQILEAVSAETLLALIILGGGAPWVVSRLRGISSVLSKLMAKDDELRNTMKDRVEIAGKVNDALEFVRRQLGADRAYIFEFHNGSRNLTGIPFAKMSNTYERCAVGIQPEILNLQNLPIGIGYLFIRCITSNEDIHIHDIEMLADRDPSTYQLLANQGIKSLYAVGIFDFDSTPVGFIGVDFCSQKKILSTQETNQLRGAAIKLCGLMLSSDYCTMTDEPRRPK
jgi:hypothetical protein